MASAEGLSVDLPLELFVVADLPSLLGGASLVATLVVLSFAAGGAELEDESERPGGGWSLAWPLRGALLSGTDAVLLARGDGDGAAAGSGAGAAVGVAAGSAGRLLSTRSEKLLASWVASGRAGFGSAF